MHATVTARVLGMLLILFSVTMLPPVAVSLIYSESSAVIFLSAFSVTLLVGLLIWLPTRHSAYELRTRDGFIITVLFWLVLSVFGTLPFLFSNELKLSFVDALFESVSGLTTTGATVLSLSLIHI